MPRVSIPNETQDKIPEDDPVALEKEDDKYSSLLSCQKIIQQLDLQRKKYFNEADFSLLDSEIAKMLFKDMNWTAKSLQKRMDGSQTISRNEFLLSIAFIQCAPLTEDEYNESNPEVLKSKHYRISNPKDLKIERYYDFMDEFDKTLIALGMSPTYPRNPFELFLSICMLHDKPYEYLMANWYQAIS